MSNVLDRDETPERDERIMNADLKDTGEMGEPDHDERTIRADED
jgi:hypothetical protein